MILDGKKIAFTILDELTEKIAKLAVRPRLAVILVGDNPSSLSYIGQKRKFSERVGIDFELRQFEPSITEDGLVTEIKKFNDDASVTGFIVQLPLPKHISADKIIAAINPRKDVDGFTPENIGKLFLGTADLISCTPKGIIRLLETQNIALRGKNVVVIGKSNIVGKPLSLLLMNAGATVTVCSRDTWDVSEFTRLADIIIVAAGSPGLVKRNMIKSGTVVIDVGFTIVDGVIRGDADFDAIEPDCLITPVPGGVGPMTVAMLMENTYLSALNS